MSSRALADRTNSGFSLLSDSHAFALRLQSSKLLWRENSFGATEKCLPAFFRAACLHALGLPRPDFCFLIWREIQRVQIDAGH